MAKCPKCGSDSVKPSMVSESLEVAGKIVTKLPIFAGSTLIGAINPNGGKFVNQMLGRAVGKAGGRLARSAYNKLVCQRCNHVWDNPKSIWED